MNSKNKAIELLVPAGSKEAFYAAVKNGADAIYLGGKNFGARAFADNFSHDDLKEIIPYAHLYGVKVYITMNTMLNEDEVNAALKEALYLHQIGVDALIVQDLGFFYECKRRYPNLELHASTQMHIHNVDGVKLAKKLGYDRVVMARETTIEHIREACATGVEIEIFTHGALCISYSGQCLMSSALFSRSGNKGACAQCCRLQYKLLDKDTDEFIETEDEYLLSPKDLNTIEYIPDLIEAGIASLKIEGRMKRPEYVGLLARLYREAIDAYYAGKKFKVTPEMIEDMKLMFNRGFTKGHIFKADSKELYQQYRPNHQGINIGKVVKYKDGQVFIKLDKDLNQGDGLRIIAKKEYGFVANRIYKDDLLVASAKANDIIALDSTDFIEKDAKVLKTTDIKLLKEINDYDFYRKVDIRAEYIAKLDQPFILKLTDGKFKVEVASDFILQASINNPMTKEKIEEKLAKTNDTAFRIVEFKADIDKIFAPVKVINEVRRQAIEKLTELRANDKKEVIVVEPKQVKLEAYSDNRTIVEVNNEAQYLKLKDNSHLRLISHNLELAKTYNLEYLSSVVNPDSKYYDGKIVASEFACLDKDYDLTNYTLNVANSYSVEFLMTLNAKQIILSSELNDMNIKRIVEEFEKRHGFKANIYKLRYGKRDLMYIKQPFISKDLISNLDLSHHYSLVDMKDRHFDIVIDEAGLTHILENEVLETESSDSCANFIRLYDEEASNLKALIESINH